MRRLMLMLCVACSGTPEPAEPQPTPEPDPEIELAIPDAIVTADEIAWEQLNPARGDASPMAADLWGGRASDQATGFVVRFVDGFSSPPHIHNVTYRGVVLSGLVHNDDPDAEEMWMQPGSFWTQPKGAVHITSAQGGETTAYIEIDSGPYLVRPTTDAFDAGEQPVNVDVSNLVWVDGSDLGWGGGSSVAFLWSAPHARGLFVRLPAGAEAVMRGNDHRFRAVVVSGEARVSRSETEQVALSVSGYFASDDSIAVTCGEGCVLYVRTEGAFDIAP